MLNQRVIRWIFCVVLMAHETAFADVVRVSFGDSMPPYGIKESNSGIDIDIHRAALASQGHELVAVFVPGARIIREYVDGFVDAASGQLDDSCCEGFISEMTIEIEDVFVSLDDRDIHIYRPEDLNPYSVMSYYFAEEHYGNWLKHSNTFTVSANQTNQLRMLLAGRVDVVMGEKRLMAFAAERIARSQPGSLKKIRIHHFTVPWKFATVFRSQTLRDDFNRGLAELVTSGERRRIIERYVQLYDSPWLTHDAKSD